MLYSNSDDKYRRRIEALPTLAQSPADYKILLSSEAYRVELLKAIHQAQQRIYITALYIENDAAGQEIFDALYQAKSARPTLDIVVFVDWHRAGRGRIGEQKDHSITNATWYCQMQQQYAEINIPIYGVPVNSREILGVLHLKGTIVDDSLFYSGASINNVYLHKFDKYRIDRYHLIHNAPLAQTIVDFLQQQFVQDDAVQRLTCQPQPKVLEIKPLIQQLRAKMRHANYCFAATPTSELMPLSITPLVGLGKKNDINRTIKQLMRITQQRLILCTPYFNLPTGLTKQIIRLLRKGIQVELIVGDKTANDFYIPESEPFSIIGAVPYLYEINLRRFCFKLRHFMQQDRLKVRLWKHNNNTYHVKGLWIDDEWMLVTGHNFNPRAWQLDLENALVVKDPSGRLTEQKERELAHLREHTLLITDYHQIQASHFYPTKIRKLLHRLRGVRIDRIIRRIL